jgi:phospholipid-binding lipoprotein MlaA
MVGDSFLSPMYYAVDATKYKIAIKGFEQVNSTSLKIGDYESLKKSALDPYISLRDAYHQYRQHKIKE